MNAASTSIRKPLSKLLLEAGLVSSAQLEVAQYDQIVYGDLPLGDALALRGWIKPETADFFTNQWPELLRDYPSYPLGFYLKAAGLLNEQQIQSLLKEQKHLGVKFGTMAVLKGWLQEKTLNFFLRHVAPQEQFASPFIRPPAEIRTPPAVANSNTNKYSQVNVAENNNILEEEDDDLEIAWAG